MIQENQDKITKLGNIKTKKILEDKKHYQDHTSLLQKEYDRLKKRIDTFHK